LVGFNALGGMAAPLFLSLAGIGSALLAASGRPRLDSILLRRGIVLMLFGVVLNLLSPSWFSWGSWFVLHMMGLAMALTPLWRRLPNATLLLLCLVIFAGTVVVQSWLNTPLFLTNDRMRDVTLSGQALVLPGFFRFLLAGDPPTVYLPWRLALAEGQFPILPWLAFYLAGFVSGRWLGQGRLGRVAMLGLAYVALGAAGHLLYLLSQAHHLPFPPLWVLRAFWLKLGFFPPTITTVSLLLGGALLLIAGITRLDARRPFSEQGFWVTLGRASLTLLIVHVPVFRELSRLRGIELWSALPAGLALAVVLGFFVLAALLTRLWQRVGYRYGAEWALRKVAD
jgi:uncharacterized membrane protein